MDHSSSGNSIKGTPQDDHIVTKPGGPNRISGHAGNDTLDISQTGGGAYGGRGDDTLIGGGPGTAQAHMSGGSGRDVFYFGTSNRDGPYGDHVWGDEGADQFHFTTHPGDTARITGRIDDFDHSRDSIWLNGEKIDLTNPPPNVRIVQLYSQPWILIDNRILYALEGARQLEGLHDADYDGHKDGVQPGNSGAEEVHFINWPEQWQDGVPASADIPYHDFQAFFPRYEVNASVPEWDMPTNSYSSANDSADGGDGDERLVGQDGRDTLRGNGGNDLIHGGEQDDMLYGGDGNDSISGGLDNDYIEGGAGEDILYGGSGQDTLKGGQGHDFLSGNNGQDLLYGGAGNDTLWGGWNDDTLYGGGGDDLLYASVPTVYPDIAFRQSAELYGGEGDDTLHGEVNGNAFMSGGEGKDHFVHYQNANIEIADFQPGVDYFDLNGFSPGHEVLKELLQEQLREDGSPALFLNLGALGSIAFLGLQNADKEALLNSMGQDGPITDYPPPSSEDDDDLTQGNGSSPEEEDEDNKEKDKEKEEEDSSDGSCFVATASYGGAAHPDVTWLRRYRNKILQHNWLGRRFIALYWKIGPVLARFMDPNGKSGKIMRSILGTIVRIGRRRRPDL